MSRCLVPAVVLAICGMAAAQPGRGDLEFTLGGGAWIPTGTDFESSLTAGPAITAGLLIPMFQSDCILLRTGYMSAGSDSSAWDGVSVIPVELGYRTYPLYRPYAGPRGLEPFLGASAGGFIAWDSPSDGEDGTSTGGAMLALELGARVRLGTGSYLDVFVRPEWLPSGTDLAGEDDLSGLAVGASISFLP
jgi:hypothetical protein